MTEVKSNVPNGTTSNNSCTNCGNVAILKCPKCVQLKMPPSYYCSQDCFKSTWAVHKMIHDLPGNNIRTLFPSFSYTGKLRAYPQTPKREIPAKIARPDYADDPDGIAHEERKVKKGDILVLNDEEIEAMRVAGRLGREVLDEAAKAIAPGVTTDEIDHVVHEACIERDCYPSPLNYYNFPKSCCTSVNEIVCHGIPDMRPLENGDLCNVDITVYHGGFHGDLNESIFVGDKVSEEHRKLVAVTYECLQKAIEFVQPGKKYRDIGKVIQKHASANGFSVVRSFCGHGINKVFHTVPTVPHYAGNRTVGVMKAGHTFTIEPMINVGVHDTVIWPDKWTAVTRDGKFSAQFEQTLLVTETGCEILTRRASGQPWFMDQLETTYKS
jgi:methionyl aminopeptidase